jgi:Tfp pilus assembly protein PilN
VPRLNLATRPFYNERALHILLAVLAVLLVVVSVFNAREVVRLSARQTALRAEVEAEEARARDVRQRATTLRAQLEPVELEQVLAAAREANTLIDRRTFSWTQLFNHLETTLPPDVMLTAVRPRATKDGFTVSLGVLGRSIDDIDAFLQKLEQTRAFSELLSQEEAPEDSGLIRATLVGRYHVTAPPPAQADAPSPDQQASVAPTIQTGGQR